MKKHQILTLVFICITFFCNAQEKTALEKLAKRNQILHISDSFQDLKDGIFDYYQNDIDSLPLLENGDVKTYNNVVLNEYFKNIIIVYANNTNDLSLTNFFANVSTSDNTLTLGGSINLGDFYFDKEKNKAGKKLKPLKKLTNLATFYVKTNYSNGFSNLIEKKEQEDKTEAYELSSSLGVGFKFTHINRGKLTPKSSSKIKDFRKTFVKEAIQKKITDYEKNELDKELALLNYGILDANEKKEIKKSKIRDKYLEFYKEIVNKELEFAKSQDFIESSHVSWWTISGYLPITNTDIKYSTDNKEIKTALFKDTRLAFNFNYLGNKNYDKLKQSSFKATAEISRFNTNTFIAKNLGTSIFQNIKQNNVTSLVLTSPVNFFSEDYCEFYANSIKGEIVVLGFNNFIGLSIAGELTTGLVKNENWKIGMPFSIADKDGNKTINFELQWRELNSEHFVGISVGYNFGKFVK